MTVRSLPEQVMFVAYHDGRVHVVDSRETDDDTAPLRRIGDGPLNPLGALLGDIPTRCGRVVSRHRSGGFDSAGSFITTFDDERLCAACYRTVPADEHDRLFAHPQSTDTETQDA
jgi:hypothetical protein